MRILAVLLLWIAGGFLAVGWGQRAAEPIGQQLERDHPELRELFGGGTPPSWAPLEPFLVAALLAGIALALSWRLRAHATRGP